MSVSWHYTAFSVLAGVGAGYLLGLIISKWLWKEDRRAQTDHSELVAAIAELTSEMARLRESIARGGLERASRRSMPAAESVSDFVSAQGDNTEESDDDEESFYDITTPNNIEDSTALEEQRGQDQLVATLDDLGKRTLQSEEVCNDLIQQLNTQLEEHPDDVEMLWRLSRALVHLSMHLQQKGDTEGEKQLLQQATEHAQQALNIDTSIWQSHQWYAVAVGSQSKHEGTQQKIKTGHEYKEHIDIAISLQSSEPTLYYLKGRWCFEVAGLSWLEKTAAAALYATPPESTYEEALECFMKVEELTPDQWKANILLVAKCWIQLGDIPTAVEWLHKAYNLPTVTSEDETSQKEIQDLLAQHDDM